jgi:tRNA (cmo5U34)-methyltransferase
MQAGPQDLLMPVAHYRDWQRVVPGLDGLYNGMRAILEAELPAAAEVLIVGAGGGREIETLAASQRDLRLTGIDPSPDMLALAAHHAGTARVTLLQGVVDDLPAEPIFDAATSLLVMHFLPGLADKRDYLRAIRTRLRPGAPYLHADVSLESAAHFARLAPAFGSHARLMGFDDRFAEGATGMLAQMTDGRAISEAATLELFSECGFRLVSPFFRGLWYAAWWAEAV